LTTQETVMATGERQTTFLRSLHPMATEEGNMMFDDGSLVELGP